MVHGVLWGTADVQKEWVEKEPGAPGDGLVLVSKDLVGKERVGRLVGRKKWRETVAKEQQSTHSLCMNLLDIISYHIISHTRVLRGLPVCVECAGVCAGNPLDTRVRVI